jgi:hypothetical protein
MTKGKIAVLLLTMLILNLSVVACVGFNSQGPQEQKRPAEVQQSSTEEIKKTVLQNPEKSMEETAKEEQTER